MCNRYRPLNFFGTASSGKSLGNFVSPPTPPLPSPPTSVTRKTFGGSTNISGSQTLGTPSSLHQQQYDLWVLKRGRGVRESLRVPGPTSTDLVVTCTWSQVGRLRGPLHRITVSLWSDYSTYTTRDSRSFFGSSFVFPESLSPFSTTTLVHHPRSDPPPQVRYLWVCT